MHLAGAACVGCQPCGLQAPCLPGAQPRQVGPRQHTAQAGWATCRASTCRAPTCQGRSLTCSAGKTPLRHAPAPWTSAPMPFCASECACTSCERVYVHQRAMLARQPLSPSISATDRLLHACSLPSLQRLVLYPGNGGLCGTIPNGSSIFDDAGTQLSRLTQPACPGPAPHAPAGSGNSTGPAVGAPLA